MNGGWVGRVVAVLDGERVWRGGEGMVEVKKSRGKGERDVTCV